MINLYLYNKEKNILGFTFHLFEGEKYVIDHDSYKDSVEMSRYFESSKCDILGINLERFISFSERNITSKTILIEESISDLQKAVKWRSKNKYEYNKFLDLIIRGESKLMTLVHALHSEEQVRAYAMYKILTDFVKEELK